MANGTFPHCESTHHFLWSTSKCLRIMAHFSFNGSDCSRWIWLCVFGIEAVNHFTAPVLSILVLPHCSTQSLTSDLSPDPRYMTI